MSEVRGSYLEEQPSQDLILQIRDAGNLHDYRIEIPNLVDDTGMSVYAFRLYVRFKRRAGDHGVSYEGTKKLAKECNMSRGKVSDAKQELKDLGLIEIENVMDETGKAIKQQNITIVDIWAQNFLRYSKKKNGNGGGGVHTVNRGIHLAG